MQFFKNLKIRHKLTLLMTVTSILSLLMVAGVLIAWGYVSARQALIFSMSTQTEMMADSCQASVAFNDAADAESALNTLRMQPSVVCAGVYTSKGDCLAHFSRSGLADDEDDFLPVTKSNDYFFENGFLLVSRDIMVNQEKAGYVILRSDLKPLKKRVRNDIALVGSVLFCAVLLAYLVSARLQHIISDPILSLARVAKQVSHNKQYDLRAVKKSRDETGTLIDAFNEMLSQIQQRDRQLVKINLNLEATVQERTSELTREVAERKHTAEFLERERNFSRSIIETAQVIILILDIDGKIVSFNPYLEEKCGYRLDGVKGHRWFDLFLAPEDKPNVQRTFEQVLEGRNTGGTINAILTRNGQRIDVQWYNKKLQDEHGNITGILSIGHDVTQQKKYENKLKEAKKQADCANEAKSTFLANMSHEIRTPMNAIIGFSDLLAEEELSTDQIEYLKLICSAGKNLLAIINDILDFSKIEAKKLDIECVEFSLEELLQEYDSMLRPAALRKNLEYEVIQCGKLPKVMKSDPLRIRQCLTNLINNAIKFTEAGHVFCHVSTGAYDGKECVMFDIEDTGIGISRDKLESIFEEFNQADNSTTRKYGGTGLGLAITRRLAQLLGGSLHVASEPGKGSTFSLVVPAGIDLKTVEKTDKYGFVDSLHEPRQVESKVCLSGKILAAEDNPSNQMLLKMLFEKMELDITIVEDGQKAVDAARREKFDMIFMDMQMPVMNGYEATRNIRSEDSDIPIVALTASAMKNDDYKCYEAGCNDYLAKPISRNKLTAVLRKYLGSNAVAAAVSSNASANPPSPNN